MKRRVQDVKDIIIGMMATIIVCTSLQPSGRKCRCRLEVVYYKDGKVLNRYISDNGASVFGSGVERTPLDFEGKTYRPDSLVFTPKQ